MKVTWSYTLVPEWSGQGLISTRCRLWSLEARRFPRICNGVKLLDVDTASLHLNVIEPRLIVFYKFKCSQLDATRLQPALAPKRIQQVHKDHYASLKDWRSRKTFVLRLTSLVWSLWLYLDAIEFAFSASNQHGEELERPWTQLFLSAVVMPLPLSCRCHCTNQN